MSRIAKVSGLLLLLSLVITHPLTHAISADESFLPDKVEKGSFAVVELFTSQGCSSCPSADRQLAKIKDFSERHDIPLYTLAFHVDYWNYLGWKDKYSSEQFSNRQRDYARIWQKNRIYTPQMIVNGVHEFVGSNEKECSKVISNELNKPAEKNVVINAVCQKKNDSLFIAYDFDRKVNGILNIAVLQNSAKDHILSGENNGQLLEGYNIVRCFEEIDCSKINEGKFSLKMPTELNAENMTIVVYLQNKIDRRVLGATEVNFL